MGKNLQFASTWKTGDEARAFWNDRARNYNAQTVNSSTSKQALIDYYVSNGFLNSESTVLDLGCGPGNFTKLIAPHVKEVVAVDISDEMLQCARENTADFQNVRFLNLNWWDANTYDEGLYNGFDFVFANMTPSIRDEETFLKMLNCSRKYCHFATFVSRCSNLDPVLLKDQKPYDNCRLIFNLLWDWHIFPQVTYRSWQEDKELTVEEALALADPANREVIENSDAFRDLIQDGMLPYHYKALCAQMFWSKDNDLCPLNHSER